MFALFFEEKAIIPLETLYGLTFLVIAAWLVIFMVDCFYYSHYFKGAHYSLPEWGTRSREKTIPYEVLEIVSHTEHADLTGGFLASNAGRAIMSRLDVPTDIVDSFIHSNRQKTYADPVIFSEPVTLVSYAEKVFAVDQSFVSFLTQHQINKNDFIDTADWVSSIYERKKESYRWWGRDSLGRLRALGKEWAKGEISLLEKYGTFVMPETDEVIFKKEIDEVETVLARASGANVLLVADEKNEMVSIVSGLAGRIRDGSVLPQIEHKKILMLNGWALDELASTNDQFETLIIRLFNQAVSAGNIILVIPDLHSFILSAKKHNINAVDFMSPYTTSPDLQIVAFTLNNSYSESLQQDTKLISLFEKIIVQNEEGEVLIRALEHKVYTIERLTDLSFTYQSLLCIADVATRKLSGDDIEEKVLIAFDKLIPLLLAKKVSKVRAADVEGPTVALLDSLTTIAR